MPVRLDQVDWATVSTAIAPPKGRFVAQVADTIRWTRFIRRSGTKVYTLSVPSEIIETINGKSSEGRRLSARIEYPDTEKGRAMGETLIKRVSRALGVDPSELEPTTVTDDDDAYNGGLVEGMEGKRYQLTISEVDDSYDNAAGEHIDRMATRFYFDPIRDEA